jgi:long-chain acyl-CoA synthetase
MYGQTETAGGIIAGQRGPFPEPGNVGTAPAGWAFDFGDNDEIRVTEGDLFDGYWRDQEETAAAFDAEGRLLTGDVGRLSDGNLAIIDRARDFIVTLGGKTLSPTTIENALKASSYISEVIVFGDNRKYVSALIELDQDTVAEWARSHNIAHGGFTSLTQDPAIVELIGKEIAQANGDLARVEQVKRFAILPKILDPEEEGEPVTPTRKVKRSLMYERFRDLVESMYDTSEEERIAGSLGKVF